MVSKNRILVILLAPVMLSATACSGGASTPQNETASDLKAQSNEPAELVVFGNPADPENVFNTRIGDAVRKKFPNYTIKYVPKTKDTTMDSLIASGSPIDLIYDSVGGAAGSVIETGSEFDISDLTKKHQLDLTRFDPGQLDAVKQFGGLYGLPIHSGGLVTYINKDIFDKFGIPYPKEGMTWDEAIDLGNKLTRNESGTQYIGLGLSISHAVGMSSLSLPYVDKKTEKAAINNDNFKKLMETLVVKPSQADGYKETIASLKRTFNNDDFMKTRTMAMFIMNYGLQDQTSFNEFQWDMAPLPVFKENPTVGTQPYPGILFVSKTSKYKDQAVEVLKYLTSDEYQLDLSKRGFIPVLKDEKIKKAFGQSLPYKDKNIVNAVFSKSLAPTAPKTKYDGAVNGALGKQYVKMVTGEVDVNSALRAAEEEGNKGIESAKASKK
ncbi:ABC transporter substrate-binding protein [Paenibacillus allorhizosphaerae]|uniref:Extracellular solute-binding protein n=1 Tax=Paenibacillus allorhizosphaerae TaxID=2849866 RepID=A0ABM8VLK8_9BACL|nr:ABC transporter substrate-binding protein [Paenibacillus allorhizosphaerae]CAG7648653.1 hypothetical protein PAECIP111802_04278 [Paenibacillus allorhizosphaerae]